MRVWFFSIIVAMCTPALAHDGPLLNSNGCHRLTMNTPGYHCHGGAVDRVETISNKDGDRDCGDFGSQLEAQWFFERNEPYWDPHRLDSDCDWIACEGSGRPVSIVAAQARAQGWLQVLEENQTAGVNSCPRAKP